VRVAVAGVEISWDAAHTGLPVEHFAAVAKQLCGFPSFFAAPLMRRVRAQFGPPKGGVAGAAAGAAGARAGRSASGYEGQTVPVPPHLVREVVAEDGTVLSPAPALSATAAAAAAGQPSQPPYHTQQGQGQGQTQPGAPVLTIPLHIGENPPAADDAEARDTSGLIPLPVFLAYWRAEMEPHDAADRFFRLLKKRGAPGIEPGDFTPYMEEVLAFHPGLAFLESTPEFQEKYARTVIARIFYSHDFSGRRVLDARQVRRSNLVQAFHTVSAAAHPSVWLSIRPTCLVNMCCPSVRPCCCRPARSDCLSGRAVLADCVGRLSPVSGRCYLILADAGVRRKR
jgi:hypothetical protein